MLKSLKRPLADLVDAKYASAKASESLTFSSSALTILHTEANLPFQLRYLPSLAKKPVPRESQNTEPRKKINPFENPDPALFIIDLPPDSPSPSHYLVLNKFPIIPCHFILATKTNKPQTAALEPDDLDAAYACLRAWEQDSPGRRLYGFFNSGKHSGASQPHRHLQFLPVEGMRGEHDQGEWDVLMDQIVELKATVPFEVFWERVSQETDKEELHAIYLRLLNKAHDVVSRFVAQDPGEHELHDTNQGDLPFSYNLGLTSKALMLVPRRRDGAVLCKDDGTEVGSASLNGTMLAGTMLVKKQEEWELLQRDGGLLDRVLQDVGIPPT